MNGIQDLGPQRAPPPSRHRRARREDGICEPGGGLRQAPDLRAPDPGHPASTRLRHNHLLLIASPCWRLGCSHRALRQQARGWPRGPQRLRGSSRCAERGGGRTSSGRSQATTRLGHRVQSPCPRVPGGGSRRPHLAPAPAVTCRAAAAVRAPHALPEVGPWPRLLPASTAAVALSYVLELLILM